MPASAAAALAMTLAVLPLVAVSLPSSLAMAQIAGEPSAISPPLPTEGDLATERERLNARLLETAALIQRSESQLSAIEKRLVDLDAQENSTRTDLASRHGQITKLLGALQRMGRNPPPVLMTGRDDALGMVRSAMLLSATFPELKDKAVALASRLESLNRVISETRAEGQRLQAETDRLNEARTRLSSLMDAKKQSITEQQTEIVAVRAASAEVSRNAKDLTDLIDRLDKTVTAKTGLGDYDAELATGAKPIVVATVPESVAPTDLSPAATTAPPSAVGQAAAPAGASVITVSPDQPAAVPPPPVPSPVATPAAKKEIEVAALPVPPLKPQVVELAPTNAAVIGGNAGRMKPAMPFASARGKLPLPAHGSRVLDFGARTQFGGQSKGMVIETRHGAQITAPCDGWVVWAGEFRSYGQLLIINAGDGYHILLAGMSQIDVEPGQFVLAAEPVGTMSGAARTSTAAAQTGKPVLYIEFRKSGRPIDPAPWWVTDQQKVQG